jgi:hypothetical protein
MKPTDMHPKVIHTDSPFVSHSENADGVFVEFGGESVSLQWTLADPERIEFFGKRNDRGDEGIIWTRQGYGIGFRLENTKATQTGNPRSGGFELSYVLTVTGNRYDPEDPS